MRRSETAREFAKQSNCGTKLPNGGARIQHFDATGGLPCGVWGLRLAPKYYSGPEGAHGGTQRLCDMCAGLEHI